MIKIEKINKKAVAISLLLLIFVVYMFWMSFNLPNSIRINTITVELIEPTSNGYFVIGRVYGAYNPVKIRMNFDKYGVNFLMEEDGHYTVIYKTGWLPYRWTVMKIRDYDSW
jgi:hypothetical protein